MATRKIVPANFREFVYNLSPGSWRRYWGQRFLGATLGLIGDVVSDGARRAVAVSKLTNPDCPPDAVDLIGIERNLPRFPGEATEPYKARLLKAWDLWQQAGTAGGIDAMFAEIGLTAEIKINSSWNWGGEGFGLTEFTSSDYYAESEKATALNDGQSFHVAMLLSISAALTTNTQAIVSSSQSANSGFTVYISTGETLTFHYYDSGAGSVSATVDLTAYIGKPILLVCWYDSSDDKAHIALNGAEVAVSAGSGVFEAGTAPMGIGRRPDNPSYVLEDQQAAIVGISSADTLPSAAQLAAQWSEVSSTGRIQPLVDGAHVWDFLDLPNPPSLIDDETTGTAVELALVGAGPSVREVGTALYWSRFWVVLTDHSWTDDGTWGDPGTWGDGGTWATTATPDEVRAVRNIVRLFKGAHEVCTFVVVVLDEPTWDTEQPDGTWGNPINRSEAAAYWST
jgi:hypothetical protein